jgi:hypothetical protein
MMVCLPLVGPRVLGQTESATLYGAIVDDSGARIPGAAIALTNDKTHDARKVLGNSEGIYNFSSLPPGSYTMLVERDGFSAARRTGIVMHPADSRNLDVQLKVGQATMTIDVSAAQEVPSNGDRTALISADDISHLSVEGRDVSELVKTQAGFAIVPLTSNNGLANGTYDPGQVTTGGGLGNFVANGSAGTGVNVTMNGADITDPTSGNSTTQNINQEMVQEVQIQTSAFGADQAKGPIVFSAVTKSGGTEFHGELYNYFRIHNLDTQNWFSKNQGLPDAQDRNLYPGANLGGPILIPGTRFNHSRRLTFFVGAEDYVQRNVYSYGNALSSSVLALVPTANMRKGNFSQAELANYLGTDTGTLATQCTSSGTLANYIHLCGQPSGTTNTGYAVTNGIIPAGGMDPGAGALLNTLPLPNRPTTGGFNYATTNFENNNLYQVLGRIDDTLSDKFKLSLTYSGEHGRNTGIPEAQYYSPANGGPSMGGVDTPGKSTARVYTQALALQLTYILSATMTNEANISAALNKNDFALANPALLNRTQVGLPYTGIYPNASQEIPELGDYNYDGLPVALYPDTTNKPYFQHTFTPTFSDSLTKILGTHILKTGVYLQRAVSNTSSATSTTNGQIQTNGFLTQYYLPNGSTFTNPDGSQSNTLLATAAANYLADFAIGDITQFFQQNFQPNLDLYFWNMDFFVTDTWKATKRLTLTFGLRFDHLGPWQDSHGNGIAIFSPELYTNPVSATLPGLAWHGIDSSVPNSGVPGRLFFYSPRFGMAYDLYGDGNTLLSGGFGFYRSHDSGGDYAAAAQTAQGVLVTSVGGSGVHLSKLAQGTTSVADCTNATLANASSHCPSLNATVYGLDRKDDQQPLTYTYNFSVTQSFPRAMRFQLAYVGSQTQHLLLENNLQNVDALPIGSLFAPDPITHTFILPNSLSVAQQGDYRPYRPYQAVDVPRHLAYSFYNGLQTSLNRMTGHVRYGVNYTWSQNLGIRSIPGQLGDPIYLRNNYGPLSSDRTHIVNATYSFDFGDDHLKAHKLLSGTADGWELSGITGFQSGPNLQAIYSPDFKLKGVVGVNNVNSTTYLGTPEVSLQPMLTCNPAAGLQPKQYVNGSCFTLPSIGTINGSFNFPYLHGPAYFDSDLTVLKDFKLEGQQHLQFRFAGFNFLNHPITSFSGRFPAEASLYFSGTTSPTLSNTTGNCSVVASACFGYAGYKQGRRVLEIAVKYSF